MQVNNEEIFKAYATEDYNKCLEYLELLPESDQNLNEIKVLKASCFVNIDNGNRIKEAHEILNEIITTDPVNSFAHFAKGLAFFKQQKLVESIEYFKKASENDTHGMVTKAMSMKLEAEELLEKQLKPTIVSTVAANVNDNNEISKVVCDICNKTFSKVYSLKRHKILHTNERNFECTLCTNKYFHKSELNRHIKRNHGENSKMEVRENKKFNCDICQKEFNFKKLLNVHKITHSKKPKMECDLCGKILISKSNLLAHMKSHINKKLKLKFKKVQKSADPEIVQASKKIKLEILSDNENSTAIIQDEVLKSHEQTVNDNNVSEMPEWNFFFKSIMHDLSKMDEKQKRQFKLKCYSLINEILD
ncbi:hypothetical protein PVAND_014844 [Polypedilum vanderplanki]|uniref:C2H2-type domain-containing protein n=1 Tax=Polypedilum vanderplanki TaxID=319348 RepID=A0A9J6BAX0_POLVA|nr:hypothetical protein PVAND_014844 [Polypedilum vanderplanki]